MNNNLRMFLIILVYLFIGAILVGCSYYLLDNTSMGLEAKKFVSMLMSKNRILTLMGLTFISTSIFYNISNLICKILHLY